MAHQLIMTLLKLMKTNKNIILFCFILISTKINAQEFLKLNFSKYDTIKVHIDNYDINNKDYILNIIKIDTSNFIIKFYESKIKYTIQKGINKSDSIKAQSFLKDFELGYNEKKLKKKYKSIYRKQKLFKSEIIFDSIRDCPYSKLDSIIIDLKEEQYVIKDFPYNFITIKIGDSNFKYYSINLIDLTKINFIGNQLIQSNECK